MTKRTVLAVGFFDSVHLGHRRLLDKARRTAHAFGTEAEVLTFDDTFYGNLGRADKEVYLLEERISILNGLGFSRITVLNPTKEFLFQSPEEFADFLMKKDPAAIVGGSDYTFGRGGKGDMELLRKILPQSVKIIEVDLKKYGGGKISTTRIKQLLNEGDIQEANALLGDSFFITGAVVKGRGVGKSLGVPTANICVQNLKQLPLEGVYKTRTQTRSGEFDSITSVGEHPTFEDRNFNIETLLLGFDGDLYGQHIKVKFISRLRGIQKFNTPERLVRQIREDIAAAQKSDDGHAQKLYGGHEPK